MSGVAYNPNDPVQTAFLSSLAQGETGGSSYAATEGYMGSNLAGSQTDAYGFPIWSGVGNSHAAGTYQFEPGTWDSIAQQYNLNFSNPQDQNAGAWYAAQQADPTLESDLQSGNYSTVQSKLGSLWPSVSGNQSAPQGLAGSLGQTEPAASALSSKGLGWSQIGSMLGLGGGSGSGSGSSSGGIVTDIENWFLRAGLIIVGIVIVMVALWMLLSSTGAVPGPKQTAKAASKALAFI